MTKKLCGIITVPFHIGDFLSGTMHMDATEKGAYIMLLLSHYQIGDDGLPNDDKKLSRIAGVSMKTWARIKPTMREKFCVEGNFWKHSRVIDTLRKVAQLSANQRAKALKKHNSVDAAAEPQHSQPKPKPKPNIVTNVTTPLPPKGVIVPDGVPDSVWEDFKKLRQTKKAPITETALNGIRREADKANIPLTRALEICCERGWTGFKAEWMKNERNKNAKQQLIDEYNELVASFGADADITSPSGFNQ